MASHPRPLTSLQSVVLTTGPFVFLWTTLRGYVQRNGRLSIARNITTWNNRLYALFSLVLASFILNDVFHFQIVDDIKSSDLAYVYHLSKVYEYVDVLSLVADGKVIGRHMAFHHLTTPFLTYFRVLNASDWQLFAFLNCFHHSLMYAYFGGTTVFRPILPLTGWAQLIAGIGLDVVWLVQNGLDSPESNNRAISVLLLARYAVLFYEELKTGSQQISNKAEKKP